MLKASVFEIEGHVEFIVIRHGIVIAHDHYHNIHTDIGDAFVAAKVASRQGTSAVAEPAFVNGIKLGTGAVTGGNTPAKSGAGAVLTTYMAGSNGGLDAGWPKVVDLGAGNGKQVEYQVTYAAGGLTSGTPITEAILVSDAGADAASASSQVYARAAVGPYTKDAFTTIIGIWHELYKGV